MVPSVCSKRYNYKSISKWLLKNLNMVIRGPEENTMIIFTQIKVVIYMLNLVTWKESLLRLITESRKKTSILVKDLLKHSKPKTRKKENLDLFYDKMESTNIPFQPFHFNILLKILVQIPASFHDWWHFERTLH